MWSQWFFGLQLPPLLLWLFASQPGSALNRAIAAAACSGNWYLEPFDNGRAETFYLLLDADVSHPAPAGQLASWESLLDQLLIPIVERWQSWAQCHQSCISAIKPILCIGIWVSCHCPSVGDNN